MHSLLAMYGSDLVDENSEIPRAFTSAVVRAVMCTRGNDFVSWSEFLEGFPIAVRQRELLWKQWKAQADLQAEPTAPLNSN